MSKCFLAGGKTTSLVCVDLQVLISEQQSQRPVLQVPRLWEVVVMVMTWVGCCCTGDAGAWGGAFTITLPIVWFWIAMPGPWWAMLCVTCPAGYMTDMSESHETINEEGKRGKVVGLGLTHGERLSPREGQKQNTPHYCTLPHLDSVLNPKSTAWSDGLAKKRTRSRRWKFVACVYFMEKCVTIVNRGLHSFYTAVI